MKNSAAAFFFLPSFHAFVSWTVTLLLYHMRWMDWFPGDPRAISIYWSVSAVFLIASFFQWRSADSVVIQLRELQDQGKVLREHIIRLIPLQAIFVLHGLGLVGLGMYISEILDIFGGLRELVSVLSLQSYLVRQSEVELISIYISYFGWIAIPLTILRMAAERRLKLLLVILVLAQLGGNLLFLDRTRPVWLVFTSMVILLPLAEGISVRRILKRIGIVVASGLIAFFSIGLWLGKTGEAFAYYGYVSVDSNTAALYYYLTGGFAYFSAVLESGPPSEFSLELSLYPLLKATSIAGLNESPPSQILPFIELPFPTNVGTFLEPYFSDGGYPLLIAAVILHSFVLNWVAIRMLRTMNPWGWFLWSTLCFIAFIAFFVPKLVSTPVWLFVVICTIALSLSRRRTPLQGSGRHTANALRHHRL